MRVLITGGAGFIGSHIADHALQNGWQVAIVDDLSTGNRDNVPAGAEFHQVDIRDREAVFKVMESFKPDFVSHQAAQASVAVSVREAVLDANINIIGTLNILDACVANNVQRIIFASTGGAIYGEVPDGKRACSKVNTTESNEPLRCEQIRGRKLPALLPACSWTGLHRVTLCQCVWSSPGSSW